MIEFFVDNFAQILGFFALIIAVIGFQINRRTKLIIVQTLACSLWAVHFYLLGALTGSAINAITVVRNYIFISFKTKYPGFALPVIFVMIYAVATALSWQNFSSLLPLAGVTAATIAFWQSNPKNIRILSLLPPPMWFVYNFINSSYAGMIVEILVFSSICVAILRYDILHKPEPSILKDKLKLSD